MVQKRKAHFLLFFPPFLTNLYCPALILLPYSTLLALVKYPSWLVKIFSRTNERDNLRSDWIAILFACCNGVAIIALSWWHSSSNLYYCISTQTRIPFTTPPRKDAFFGKDSSTDILILTVTVVRTKSKRNCCTERLEKPKYKYCNLTNWLIL